MEFTSGPYYSAMDREYSQPAREEPKLEKPIIPVKELGITVVEKDPVTGGNIIQNTEAAIRQGTSKIQLVFNTSHQQPMGGTSRSYGKEVRENLKELAKANEVLIEGVELPTSSMSNLSGFDPQHRGVSEQKRVSDLQEVKDAIKFLADVGGGGGVDIYSQEFSRNIYDASWNQKGKWANAFQAFPGEKNLATEFVVDKKTGEIQQVNHAEDIFEPEYRYAKKAQDGFDMDGRPVKINPGDWLNIDGKRIDPNDRFELLQRVPEWDEKKKEFKINRLDWDAVVEKTKKYNELNNLNLEPGEYALRLHLENRWVQAKGSSTMYTSQYEDYLKQRDALKDALKHYEEFEKAVPPAQQDEILREDPVFRHFAGAEFVSTKYKKPTDIIKHQMEQIEHHLRQVHETSAAADAQVKELARKMDEIVSLKKFALAKSVESYAEAGIAAMDESKYNKNVGHAIHVGPEIGWPTGYGGHPEEFIELIKESRKKMAFRLEKEQGMSGEEAKKLAHNHIKGTFDTGHMGMWLQHFQKAHPQETEEQRVARFKEWYMDMTKRMQKEDVIGGIQVVDSATGAHGHLPAGQGGLFPVVEAVEFLRSQGFDGFIVSEGHEEEQFGRGRILLQTWRAFGADIATSYFAPESRQRWSDVSEAYFGHGNPPPYIVGEYRPSEDWVFWSGMPLE